MVSYCVVGYSLICRCLLWCGLLLSDVIRCVLDVSICSFCLLLAQWRESCAITLFLHSHFYVKVHKKLTKLIMCCNNAVLGTSNPWEPGENWSFTYLQKIICFTFIYAFLQEVA